jgi:hypothetical protein
MFMTPVLIEIVAPMMWSMGMGCRGCGLVFETIGLRNKDQKACLDSYPEDWKEAIDTLSSLVRDIRRLYRHRIHIRIIDALSPLGIWKQLRHRVFRFPAFIVGDGRKTYVGWDYQELGAIIDEEIHKSI